jgi:S1-C subfamily serine protease
MIRSRLAWLTGAGLLLAMLPAAGQQPPAQRDLKELEKMTPEQLNQELGNLADQIRRQMGLLRQQNPYLRGLERDRAAGRAPSRLGVVVAAPEAVLADQLNLAKGQGLVVGAVQANSPAAKAGIKANDILLEFAGKPVPSSGAEFSRLVAEAKANTPLDVVVLRKGKKETVKDLTLPERPAAAPAPKSPK